MVSIRAAAPTIALDVDARRLLRIFRCSVAPHIACRTLPAAHCLPTFQASSIRDRSRIFLCGQSLPASSAREGQPSPHACKHTRTVAPARALSCTDCLAVDAGCCTDCWHWLLPLAAGTGCCWHWLLAVALTVTLTVVFVACRTAYSLCRIPRAEGAAPTPRSASGGRLHTYGAPSQRNKNRAKRTPEAGLACADDYWLATK